MVMKIQLRDVEYFAMIAEHGQVQRAAAALGLSQPALSKSLNRLEQSTNAKLIKRTPKGVELTSAGSALLARVSKLRLSVDDVAREITDLSAGRAGHLRIGMTAALGHVVPMVCTKLIEESPRLSLQLVNGAHADLATAISQGTLDLAVGAPSDARQDDLIEVHLFDEASAIYAAARHRLAKRRQVTLAELVKERWALPLSTQNGRVQVLTQAFGNLNLPPPRIAVESRNEIVRFRLVATSDLLTCGSKPVAQYVASDLGIVALRVQGFSLIRRVCVYYRKDAYLPPAALRFIELLKAKAREIAKENR
jgi:DNA-binding transcriptional LysR family regulator